MTSQSPDDFLSDLHAAFPDARISSVNIRVNLRKTTPSVETFIDALEQSALRKFSEVLYSNLAELR